MTADPAPDASETERPPRRISLSFKILVLTVLFVLVSEAAFLVPSIANFRRQFLEDRLATARAATVLLESNVWPSVPRPVQDALLRQVDAMAIVLKTGEASRLLATVEMPPEIDTLVDLRNTMTMDSVRGAIGTLFAFEPQVLRVIGPIEGGKSIEIVVSDRRLRGAMLKFTGYLLGISLIVSIFAGALVYLTLNRLFVRPMRRLSEAMVEFSAAPEDTSRIIRPSGRRDEIGVAEAELAAMQQALSEQLTQSRHLADLGLAVSKINHDLRNLLASAQLFSDRIGAVADPMVQRFAPKLIATLDRAIEYTQSTLAYGRAREPEPNRRLVSLAQLVGDVFQSLGLDGHPTIRCEARLATDLEIDADPDQLFRVLLNLCRNAMQAMDGVDDPVIVRRLTIEAVRQGGVVSIRVRDTGPGVPERTRQHLFQAFQGAGRPGGTGLGLAIAAEIVRAHGGSIVLLDEIGPGAHFEIVLPDRPASFDRAVRSRAG
mgnify:CR=1 FL=1